MNRSATSVMFGFDFQVNCAIVLMLENIASLKTLRLEGEEDIEIVLEDDSYVLAQAKGIVKASTDFSNVRSKLKGALESLSDASNKLDDVNQIIYITNSPNPLNDEKSRPQFYGPAHRKYSDLPLDSQNIIKKYLEAIPSPLDPSKLSIQVLPFESDDPKEKYKVVLESISDFLGRLNICTDGLRGKLHDIWAQTVFDNGTKTNRDIKLSKREVLWPLIVCLVDKSRITEDDINCSGLDESEFNELMFKYESIINSKCERFEFVTKVICDYERLRKTGVKTIQEFVSNHWALYEVDFNCDTIEQSIRPSLIKVVVSNILFSRNKINSIKTSCHL